MPNVEDCTSKADWYAGTLLIKEDWKLAMAITNLSGLMNLEVPNRGGYRRIESFVNDQDSLAMAFDWIPKLKKLFLGSYRII